MTRSLFAAALLVACGTAPAPRDTGTVPPPPALRAAVATFDITPEPGVDIVGLGTRASTEVRDPLEGAVLVLEREGARVALVTMDLPGISDYQAQLLRARAARAIRGGVEQVIVAASHTHSAPMLGDDAWSAATHDAVERAAEEALGRLEPVRLALGQDEIGFDVNRRLVVDGVAEARPNPAGPHDSRVRTLTISNDAGPIGLITHVVCHPNVLLGVESTRISADFPGEARARLRERFGAPWLVIIGAAGDVRPMVVDAAGEFRLGDDADLERLGAELAEAVERGAGAARAIEGAIGFARDVLDAPNADGSVRAIELSAWRIGPLAIVSVPAEPMVEIGLSIERALIAGAAEEALVVGYANGYASYLVTPEAVPLGGYEVEHSTLHASAAARIEERLVELTATLY